MSIFVSAVTQLVQSETLIRELHDALTPNQYFRTEAEKSNFPVHIGGTHTFSRKGRLRPRMQPRTPGVDISPATWGTERWEVEAKKWGNRVDTDMPSSAVALVDLSLDNAKQLGIDAGITLNRLCRNEIFKGYEGGWTVTNGAAGPTVSVVVRAIAGFRKVLVLTGGDAGKLVDVSVTHPLPAYIVLIGVPTLVSVTAATPTDALYPDGAGTLTFAAPVTYTDRNAVYSAYAPSIYRIGGGLSIDSIASTEIITLDDVVKAKAELKQNNVFPHEEPDGRRLFHVHITPLAMAQLSVDSKFLQAIRAFEGHPYFGGMARAVYNDMLFIENTELPETGSVETGDTYQGELSNAAGVSIHRAVITGAGCLYEHPIPHAEFISAAGLNGKASDVQVTSNGVAVNAEGVKLLMVAPIDAAQEQVRYSWVWNGGFGVPSDQLTGTAAQFKRAIVIQHA